MKTTEIFYAEGCQAVKLPDEFCFKGNTVTVRKEGDAVVLEPVKVCDWPVDFFESIRVDDPLFSRPPQGETPPVPSIDSAS